ncbi:hypothetical protein PHMEG_0009225 [Phytophthora megakarya]|uniref:Uncharacterized protein n=1 Tax=Phytophthora megakarya TaxID=4795 RepID=A0A225WHB2_9STRA|nr:hypothetical protein PHMEG_0009225 [Phytophthora megakarya]
MGLKSRHASMAGKTGTKPNNSVKQNLGEYAPTAHMEDALAPHAPMEPTCGVTQSLTPYQKMKQLLVDRAATPNTITAVEDLQEFLKHPNSEEKVAIRMKLLWISGHTYQQWQLVRLHLVDADSPESLDDLLSVGRSCHMDIDPALLTVTVWNVDSGSNLLPPPGAVVTIRNYSNLRLYQDTQCQLTARLSQLSWEGAPQ